MAFVQRICLMSAFPMPPLCKGRCRTRKGVTEGLCGNRRFWITKFRFSAFFVPLSPPPAYGGSPLPEGAYWIVRTYDSAYPVTMDFTYLHSEQRPHREYSRCNPVRDKFPRRKYLRRQSLHQLNGYYCHEVQEHSSCRGLGQRPKIVSPRVSSPSFQT